MREWKKLVTLKKEVDTESWFDITLNEAFVEFLICGELSTIKDGSNFNIMMNGINVSYAAGIMKTTNKKIIMHILKIDDILEFELTAKENYEGEASLSANFSRKNVHKFNGDITSLQIGTMTSKLNIGSNIVVYAR